MAGWRAARRRAAAVGGRPLERCVHPARGRACGGRAAQRAKEQAQQPTAGARPGAVQAAIAAPPGAQSSARPGSAHAPPAHGRLSPRARRLQRAIITLKISFSQPHSPKPTFSTKRSEPPAHGAMRGARCPSARIPWAQQRAGCAADARRAASRGGGAGGAACGAPAPRAAPRAARACAARSTSPSGGGASSSARGSEVTTAPLEWQTVDQPGLWQVRRGRVGGARAVVCSAATRLQRSAAAAAAAPNPLQPSPPGLRRDGAVAGLAGGAPDAAVAGAARACAAAVAAGTAVAVRLPRRRLLSGAHSSRSRRTHYPRPRCCCSATALSRATWS
jgi:hypothetical protein